MEALGAPNLKPNPEDSVRIVRAVLDSERA
jgi:hypothetical protein